MTHPPVTTRSAFTFIEVLVALAIAAIALLGLLRLHLLSTAAAEAAQTRTQAVFLAQEKIAEASAFGFPQQGATSGAVQRNGRDFAWRTDITDANPAESNRLRLTGLRQVRAVVTWTDGSGRKTVQMTTLLADSRIHESKTP